MNPVEVFALQFLWFLAAWVTVALLFVGPAIARLHPDDALSVWLAPQMFRVLGAGLLVSNLAPDLPRAFAAPTAAGDSLTAILALLSVIGLRRRWPIARHIAWACTIVGSADLMIALPHAAAVQAARYLTAQWYVPALGVPLMIVCHAMAFRTLVRGRSREGNASAANVAP